VAAVSVVGGDHSSEIQSVLASSHKDVLAQIADSMDAGASSKRHAGAGLAHSTGTRSVNILVGKSVLPSSTVKVRFRSNEHIKLQFRRTDEGKYVRIFCTCGPVLFTHKFYRKKLLDGCVAASIANGDAVRSCDVMAWGSALQCLGTASGTCGAVANEWATKRADARGSGHSQHQVSLGLIR